MKDNHATSHAVTTLISLDMSESGIVALSYTVLDVAATKHAAGKIAPATKAAKPAASKAERAVPEPKPKGTSAVVIEHNPSEAPKARGGRAAAASKPTVEELSKPQKAEALKPSPPKLKAVDPIAAIAAASPRSWPTKPSPVAAATPEPQSPSEEPRPAKRKPTARSEPHPKTFAKPDPSPRGSRAGGKPTGRKVEARSVVRADDEIVDNPYPGADLSTVSSTGQVGNPYVHREIEREQRRAAATLAPLLTPLLEAERRELERRERLLEQQRWQKMMEQQEKLVQAGITAMSVARLEREVEMRSLEAKLADMTQQRHTAYAEEAETLQEDAVQSVVQHLSSFGLNRNLPWQIYATRPKRFGSGGAAAPAAPAGPPPLLEDAASAVEQLDALYKYNPYLVLDTPELDPAGGGAAPAALPRSTRRRMASIYDRPARPHGFVSPRQPRDYRANEAFPPVRGAQPPPGISAAWASPRSSGTPRALAPLGAYAGG